MRPITVSSHRVGYPTPTKPVQGTPSAKAAETQIHTGTSVKTTATSVLPLTTTAHPQQTPPTRSLLSDTTQALKTTQAASAFIGQNNESNQPPLTTKGLFEATKPLFKLLQKVEDNVDVAYGKRDAIRSSAQDQKGANKSASAKTLDSFRQQRNELQRTGKTGDLSSTEAYKALKGNRPSSQFERLLPTDSQFRHLLDPFTGGIRDVQTGLYVELHVAEESGDLVMVFPGSGAADMGTKQWQTNLAQFSGKGGVPAMYAQAAELAKEIQTLQNSLSFDNHDQGGLQLVGHSLGGGIANYVGLKHGLPATCYNAAALGRACLKDLGHIPKDRIAQQTHIHFKGDTISSKKTQSRLAALLTVVWQASIVIPQHVGVIYDLKPQTWTKDLGFWGRHRSSAFNDHYFPEAGAIAYARTLKFA